jgi:hypothetical protein
MRRIPPSFYAAVGIENFSRPRAYRPILRARQKVTGS